MNLDITCIKCKTNCDSNCNSSKLVNVYKNAEESANIVLNDSFSMENDSYLYYTKEKLLPDENFLKMYGDKNILLVGFGSLKRLHVLLRIKKFGFRRFIGLSNEHSWANQYFDDCIIIDQCQDLLNKDFVLNEVLSYCKKNEMKFDAIFTYDEYFVHLASFLGNHFKLPGIPFEFIDSLKDKHDFRNLCTSLNITTPAYFLIKSDLRKNYLHDFEFSTKSSVNSCDNKISCKYPVIIKNSKGSGKDFVRKCRNIDEFLIFVEESLNTDLKMDLLVEEFFEGHEIDIEILIQDNEIKFLCISDNFIPMEPWFFEQGGISPSLLLSSQETKYIEIIVSDWISKLNLKNAVLHFEAKVKPNFLSGTRHNYLDFNSNLIGKCDYLMPIEMNMRLGGAETCTNVKTAFDIDLIHEYVKICLGFKIDQRFNTNEIQPVFRAISFDFHPAKKVLLKSIKINLKKILELDECVQEVVIAKSPGDKLEIKEYIGWIIGRFDLKITHEEVQKNLNKLIECVEFETLVIS